ncbi:hypothetical protein C5Y96_11920 [Blastopirellula marina]|uniref:Uncharacterized protein n=1 Tax=Blastopirellula marina TaxID=124 RepID=A0A2S8FG56_9BACT|nr:MULTISPECIES: hypothetical protein [Pirellulaceae]PQO31060.1 hypothetical protein C5Y96_11920 [Blastopirellula marina]RCS51454.1 hypothetical protein DTL36_11930 [Bremerella cremea]
MDRIPTIEDLRQSLCWPHIEEHLGDEQEISHISILPSQEQGESIFVLMDQNRGFGGYVGFGPWHYHPDTWEDAEPTVFSLIYGEVGVIEGLNSRGEYREGRLGQKGDWPETLGRDIKKLRHVFFDQPPETVTIDFTQYHRGKHLWVRQDVKERTENLCREHGMELPDF